MKKDFKQKKYNSSLFVRESCEVKFYYNFGKRSALVGHDSTIKVKIVGNAVYEG